MKSSMFGLAEELLKNEENSVTSKRTVRNIRLGTVCYKSITDFESFPSKLTLPTANNKRVSNSRP